MQQSKNPNQQFTCFYGNRCLLCPVPMGAYKHDRVVVIKRDADIHGARPYFVGCLFYCKWTIQWKLHLQLDPCKKGGGSGEYFEHLGILEVTIWLVNYLVCTRLPDSFTHYTHHTSNLLKPSKQIQRFSEINASLWWADIHQTLLSCVCVPYWGSGNKTNLQADQEIEAVRYIRTLAPHPQTLGVVHAHKTGSGNEASDYYTIMLTSAG